MFGEKIIVVLMLLSMMAILSQCSRDLTPNPYTTVLRLVVQNGS
tara:strand:+ start:195 stop:326 length:132 start_codon:yes stop_codon:yes gene_type:complete